MTFEQAIIEQQIWEYTYGVPASTVQNWSFGVLRYDVMIDISEEDA